MDPLELIESTADAAFATDEEDRIVIWNRAAERLLGYKAEQVLGKACHEVLCGRDVYGNSYCDENCNIVRMVARKEPIRRFHLSLKASSGTDTPVHVSILTVRGPRPSQFTIIHLLQAASEPASDTRTMLHQIPGSVDGADPKQIAADLTPRESEVLRLMAEGAGTTEIADALFISVATVRTHTQNILKKLDAHSQAQAVSLALRNRLI
ncbi:MAG: PAS domain-containing protein [Acidobacteria bacterium]|uniref:PAS domain-containing protein n=1 Tax=Candidatus Polarisedimenticola svalbardensis TaxID=2886004 RepID=A0A8J6Y0A0_9BACT|nr:PAS domain-containing protein [Candidatus Polarisedimenticola svalbardensis]